MNAVDLFQQMNEDITVSYRYGVWDGFEKRTKVWMASGAQADVMQINYGWLTQYSPDGEGFYDLYQLSDYIDLSTYTASDLTFGEVNGKLNAIPIAFNTTTIYYNSSILNSHGLDVPQTWEDLFDAAAVLRDDDIYLLGMPQKQLFLFLISYYEQESGSSFFSQDGQLLATPETLEPLLVFYKQMVDEHVVMPVDQFSIIKFTNGEVAGSLFWISDADKYCGALEDNGVEPLIAPYPTFSGGTLSGWYMKPATMYAISSTTQYPEASAKLLNFLVNSAEMADYQQTEKGVPVSSAAIDELTSKDLLDGYGYESTQQMWSVKSSMEIMLPVMEDENVIAAFKQGADEYLYDQASLSDCAQIVWDSLTDAISER
jgi:oligogalacturonide transport system substrate-binding protein